MMFEKVFLDASYCIALSSPKDKYHKNAILLSNYLEENNVKIVTTRAVIMEIINALSKIKYRQACIDLIISIEADQTIEIIPITEDLFSQAFSLFQKRIDKEWGITDCLSFVVMKGNSITDALTADIHFKQAGFNALLIQ